MTKIFIYLTSEKITYSLSLLIIKFQELEVAVLLKRSVQVPNVVVDFSDDRVVSEALALRHTQPYK